MLDLQANPARAETTTLEVRERRINPQSAGGGQPPWNSPSHKPGMGGPRIVVEYLSHYNYDRFGHVGYANPGDSGFDLVAAIDRVISIGPGQSAIIPTGIKVALPPKTELQIRSRSGLAGRYGVCVLNSPGTVDNGYRGEIKVILHNTSRVSSFDVDPGLRIAQAVLAPVLQAELIAGVVDDMTVRGTAGFGSTGLFKAPEPYAGAIKGESL
mgnify:FL=1